MRGATAMTATRTSVCVRMASAECKIRYACLDRTSEWLGVNQFGSFE